MRFVVTGGQGFIGKALVQRLAKEHSDIVSVDITPPPDSKSTSTIHHQANLMHPQNLIPREAAGEKEFVLIHLAWDMQRRDSFKEQASSTGLLAGLLDYWGPRSLKYLIVAGSAVEYGARGGILREDQGPEPPLSAYGWGKRASYDIAASCAMRWKLPLIWLRPFIIYGPGQSGGQLIPYAVSKALNGLPATFSKGLQERDFVHIDDVVDAVSRVCQLLPTGIHTLNLGTGTGVPVRDVILELARLFDAGDLFSLGSRPLRDGEPSIQVADISRAKALLDWNPRVSWQTGLKLLHRSTTRSPHSLDVHRQLDEAP